MAKIKLINHQDGKKLNKKLEVEKLKDRFLTETDLADWVDEINKDKDHPIRHLKPKERDMTKADLQEMVPAFTETGTLNCDPYSGRMPQEEMQKVVNFVIENKDKIEYIEEFEILLERGNITDPKIVNQIKMLEKPEEELEKLPEEEQYIPDIGEGVMLCKTFSPTQTWVAFGNVEKPQILKEKIYKDNIYNNVYRNKNGNSFILIPLYDFRNAQEFTDMVMERLWELGIREHPVFFMTVAYKFSFDIEEKEFIKEINQLYEEEEKREKIKFLTNKIQMLHKVMCTEPAISKNKAYYSIKNEKDGDIKNYKKICNAFIKSLNKKIYELTC